MELKMVECSDSLKFFLTSPHNFLKIIFIYFFILKLYYPTQKKVRALKEELLLQKNVAYHEVLSSIFLSIQDIHLALK